MASLRGSCLGLEFYGSASPPSAGVIGRKTKVALRALFWFAVLPSSALLAVKGWSPAGASHLAGAMRLAPPGVGALRRLAKLPAIAERPPPLATPAAPVMVPVLYPDTALRF